MTHESNAPKFAGLILLNRLVVGWYFMWAGWGKVSAELEAGLGSFYRGDSFQGRNPDWLPTLIAAPYGYALPWAELMLGVLLMIGLFGRAVAGALAVVSASIGVALLHVGELWPRHHIMVFASLTLLLAVTGPGRYSLDALWRSRRGYRLEGAAAT